jgi:hypothetical protein
LNIQERAASVAQPGTDKDQHKDKEIASAGRTLFLAAFTIILGSAVMTYILQLMK